MNLSFLFFIFSDFRLVSSFAWLILVPLPIIRKLKHNNFLPSQLIDLYYLNKYVICFFSWDWPLLICNRLTSVTFSAICRTFLVMHPSRLNLVLSRVLSPKTSLWHLKGSYFVQLGVTCILGKLLLKNLSWIQCLVRRYMPYFSFLLDSWSLAWYCKWEFFSFSFFFFFVFFVAFVFGWVGGGRVCLLHLCSALIHCWFHLIKIHANTIVQLLLFFLFGMNIFIPFAIIVVPSMLLHDRRQLNSENWSMPFERNIYRNMEKNLTEYITHKQLDD